jgi:hypothetical protein
MPRLENRETWRTRRVNILVEGKTRDTLAGHADLTESFDVTAVEEAGKR